MVQENFSWFSDRAFDLPPPSMHSRGSRARLKGWRWVFVLIGGNQILDNQVILLAEIAYPRITISIIFCLYQRQRNFKGGTWTPSYRVSIVIPGSDISAMSIDYRL